MRHHVLVIDDQSDQGECRRESYENLASVVSSLVPGFEIGLEFVDRPEAIPILVRQNRYSAAIVDAVLEEYWPSCDLDFVLKHIGRDIPIALVSKQWDNTNSEQLNRAWEMPNCRTFLHWRDITGEVGGNIKYAVAQFSGMVANASNLEILLDIGHDQSINILHISDLQIGGIDSAKLKLEANRSAEHVLEKSGGKSPTFVAFTGDVAEHGTPSQYFAAEQWLQYFLDRLEFSQLPTSKLLVVPGNHDVSIPLAAAGRLKLEKKGKTNEHHVVLDRGLLQADLVPHAYSPFRKFLERVALCPMLPSDGNDQSMAWVEARFRHLGIAFYGLNTAQPASAFGLPSRRVEADALARIGKELSDSFARSEETLPLVVGLGHHCPVPAHEDRGVENPEDFGTHFKGRVKTGLFLHGHIHDKHVQYVSEDGFRLVRSCASTLTKDSSSRPPDSLRGFNLLELKRSHHRVSALNAACYGWVGSNILQIGGGAWDLSTDGMFREAS